jgi:hypothetical protein
LFNEHGYLDQDERLCTYIQEFVEIKFEILPIQVVLSFALFFKEIGLWYWNINLMQMINSHFEKFYYNYDFSQLCSLIKLVGYNHIKSLPTLSLFEDCVKVHIESLATDLEISEDALSDLIEGVSVGSCSRKRTNA